MKNVVIGFLGSQLDMGKERRWKPTPSLFMHDGFPVERLELLYDTRHRRLAHNIKHEIQDLSPTTEVLLNVMDLADPWDFQEVYGAMFDFARDLEGLEMTALQTIGAKGYDGMAFFRVKTLPVT